MARLNNTASYDPSPALKYFLGRSFIQSPEPSPKTLFVTTLPEDNASSGTEFFGIAGSVYPMQGNVSAYLPSTTATLPSFYAQYLASDLIQTAVFSENSDLRRRITKWSGNAVNPPSFVRATDGVLQRRIRVRELRLYLERIVNKKIISPRVAREALLVWETLNSATGSILTVPNAAPGDEGDLLMVWDAGRHHLEIEVTEDSMPSAFYADRAAVGSSWIVDINHDVPPSDEILKALLFFSQSSGG